MQNLSQSESTRSHILDYQIIVFDLQFIHQLQMLNRNNRKLLSSPNSNFQALIHPNQPALRPEVHSPPPLLHRYQRKSRDEQLKSSSSTNRLKMKYFQKQTQEVIKPPKGVAFDKNQYEIINDYFPIQQAKNIATLAKANSNNQKQASVAKRQNILIIANTSPSLTTSSRGIQQQEKDKRDQQSVSTEESKQCSVKEVKFGGIVQETQKEAFKKREKVRSPSILKNGSRNILNESILSASRDRSCSVASVRDRKQKEKRGNETSINMIIKQKYKSILTKLQTQSQVGAIRGNRFSGATYNSEKPVITSPHKYKDDIFPPVYSSLFCLKKSRPKVGEQVQWMRISTLFKQRDLVLAKPRLANIQILRSDDSYCEEYFPAALNCLLGCPPLLEKMFQNQSISPYGVYLVKIFQQSVWKYIIVDDYIPVIKNKQGKTEPAFVNVRSAQGPLDIWPFLVEKAYANYYSSYEALQFGNCIDMLEELTGTPSQTIQLKSEAALKKDKMSAEQMQDNLNKALKYIKSGNAVILGELCGEKGHAPIVYHSQNEATYWFDPFCEYKSKKIDFQVLKDTFKAIIVIFPQKMICCSATALRKARLMTSQVAQNSNLQPELPSIRTFKITQTAEYNISLRQRDKRFYHFKEKHGDYIWCRAILLQKQYQDCGFRWIDGAYSQKKTINFVSTLEPGEYWLLIEPEWKKTSAGELLISVMGPAEVQFRRQLYKREDKIMQKGSLDLAQRYGELNQINKFICSYNYITEKVGLIIQNIVNQRVTGSVSVMRSIRGLKCKSEILPVNAEFYEAVSAFNGEKLYKLNQEIELEIGCGLHFTVVLKMKGGIDSKFFRTFDFGC